MTEDIDKVSVFWFRRDLRLDDNSGLHHALKNNSPVLPVFIFDKNILSKLSDKKDQRVTFIHQVIQNLKEKLEAEGSSLKIFYSTPFEAFKEIVEKYNVSVVYTNTDYEPYAKKRDEVIAAFLSKKSIDFLEYKDHVFFEKNEVTKNDGKPYTIFTPYSKKWKAKVNEYFLKAYPNRKYFNNLLRITPFKNISLEEMGFSKSEKEIPKINYNDTILINYKEKRDFPAQKGTTKMSVHLRFGTVSIRKLVKKALHTSEAWLNELIWRDFYQMIIHHFPHSAETAFKPKYDKIEWLNEKALFKAWCNGNTGYPIVDAGMRELNTTGFMHNRIRMIVASFLTKHLLIDWRWGEAYFAKKLLDFELASNNGGWQWAASTGCDATPYFRIFNPTLQTKRFDPNLAYIKKWVPEFENPFEYAKPVVEHSFARNRAIQHYKKFLID